MGIPERFREADADSGSAPEHFISPGSTVAPLKHPLCITLYKVNKASPSPALGALQTCKLPFWDRNKLAITLSHALISYDVEFVSIKLLLN